MCGLYPVQVDRWAEGVLTGPAAATYESSQAYALNDGGGVSELADPARFVQSGPLLAVVVESRAQPYWSDSNWWDDTADLRCCARKADRADP